MKDETKCLHAGYTPKNGEPRVLPIVQSTTYVYESAAEVAGIFDDPTKDSVIPVLPIQQSWQSRRKLQPWKVVSVPCVPLPDRQLPCFPS